MVMTTFNFFCKLFFFLKILDQRFLRLCFLYCNCTCLTMNLCDAVDSNELERVMLLVKEGADKDMFDDDGLTPLHRASFQGHFDILQYLVEQGATIDKTTTPPGEWTPLASAAANGQLEVVRYLLEQGADRDKADCDGRTPLHDAAREGHLETAMLLMSYGADLNARSGNGELAIDIADTEEIRQAIRDEPRRRMDHGHKRATEQDRHPNAAASASAQQQEEDEVEGEEEGENQSNKRPRLNEGAIAVEETKVAEEDEDSEPSSDGEDD